MAASIVSKRNQNLVLFVYLGIPFHSLLLTQICFILRACRVPCKIVSRATLGTRAIGSPALV